MGDDGRLAEINVSNVAIEDPVSKVPMTYRLDLHHSVEIARDVIDELRRLNISADYSYDRHGPLEEAHKGRYNVSVIVYYAGIL